MKTIQLTHGDSRLDMTEAEAVSLHSALSEALASAGIDPEKHRTLQAPNSVKCFARDSAPSKTLTDC